MDSVTDICKHHFLCFVTITGQGHSQVTKVEKGQTNFVFRDLELRLLVGGVFRLFAKNREKLTLLNGCNDFDETLME